MRYLLALDQGTTSSRAIVFDTRGQPRGVAQAALELHYPKEGWVETDAEGIWTSQRRVARDAIDAAGLTARDIAAIGIANQRETTIVWDRSTGEPIAPAIVWQDRRTTSLCQQLRDAGRADEIEQKTGLLLDPYFSATKLRWLLDHMPGTRAKARAGELAFGTVDTWLLWKLTGGRVHATDASNASRTLLCDIHRAQWDTELLARFDVPRAMLPSIRPTSGDFGESDASVLGEPVPITGVAGDQQAALFGQMATEPGMAKNTYGTGCFLLQHTGKTPVVSANKLVSTIAWQFEDRVAYALEGSIFVAGAIVQWLRDGLGLIGSASDVEALARTVDDNGGVYLVPALAGLGAPYWDPQARGTMLGITRGTTGGHIARAALEGIAFQVADVLEAMRRDAEESARELRVDGGASVNDLLMQLQADIAQTPVLRPRVQETTALGAAYLAGLGAGVFEDVGAIAQQWQLQRRFDPGWHESEAQRCRDQWQRAVKRAAAWADA